MPRSLCWPPRHATLAPTGLAAASRPVGLSHFPRLWVRQWAPRLTWPARSGRADRVARSAVSTRVEHVTWGRHLRRPMGNAVPRWGSVRVVTTGWRRVVTTRLAQGLAWGRVWLGAGRWRACSSLALTLAATVRRAVLGGSAGHRTPRRYRLGHGRRHSCPMPDAYLHAFRLPGFRR